MPTTKQRRAAAKRKLERQLERRAKQARRRRIFTIVGAFVFVVAVVAAVLVTIQLRRDSDKTASSDPNTPAAEQAGVLPPFIAPPDLGANCTYPATAEQAAKPVEPPRSGKVPTDPAVVSVSMVTDHGPIPLKLDNAKAPCTVNSFASLAQKQFFNDTPCHRLTTSKDLSVLQCGDPTGKGTGGPGYSFANEYPTNQYAPDDPAAQEPVVYPRGTIAMANSGPNTNGSQFFLVYRDSKLPPQYTVFGTIDEAGLATLDKIAQAGVAGGGEDGAPATPVNIKTVQLD